MIYKSVTTDGQKVDPQVLADSRLSANARWFYAVMCFIDPTENYTDEELSGLLDVEQRTVINLRNELQSKGYLTKIRNGRVITVFLGNSETTPAEVVRYWSGAT